MTLDERALERYFIKPLNDDRDSLEDEECLPGSSDLDDRSLPIWTMNESPASLIGPNVSTATRVNM